MSAPKRFFVERIEEETLLEGEEFEHAKNVLRLAVGDEVVLLDNSGKEYAAVIAAVEKRNMKLHVLKVNEGDREATTDVVLLFGYLKNADKNEFIVQKAVELGVKKIIAFSSEYSSAFMNLNKLERLNKISRESAKQCLRSVAPEVTYCEHLKDALAEVCGYKNKLFACEFAKGAKRIFQNFSAARRWWSEAKGDFRARKRNSRRHWDFPLSRWENAFCARKPPRRRLRRSPCFHWESWEGRKKKTRGQKSRAQRRNK